MRLNYKQLRNSDNKNVSFQLQACIAGVRKEVGKGATEDAREPSSLFLVSVRLYVPSPQRFTGNFRIDLINDTRNLCTQGKQLMKSPIKSAPLFLTLHASAKANPLPSSTIIFHGSFFCIDLNSRRPGGGLFAIKW